MQRLTCYEASGDTTLVHSTGAVVRGIDAIRRDYEAAFGATEFVAVQYLPAVARQSHDSAWLTGRLWMHTRQAGQNFVLEIRATHVLQWTDSAWRIVMEQSTPLEGIPRVRELQAGEKPRPPEHV